jgi:L-ectoine synthase
MGFSLHKTTIRREGGIQHWHYKHHLEACYCIQGKGLLVDLKSGEEFLIEPDVIYVLDQHDDHTFQAIEDVVLICIFNPPVVGCEVHDEQGSYPELER